MKSLTLSLLILILTTLLPAKETQAQSIDQLLEQLFLDREKLSTLKSILDDMYRNYTELEKGYSVIRDIAKGNFSLHKTFLDGLLVVSPNVRQYYRLALIMEDETALVREYKSAYARWQTAKCFSPGELHYISGVYARLLNKSITCMNELTMVTTDEDLRMSDAGRIQAIDRVYEAVAGLLASLRRWNDRTGLLVLQRQHAKADYKTINQLYGIP